ncbi:MAG: TAXI family TRAP transporter solute-binding subunit [Pirellulaceae bacterium]
MRETVVRSGQVALVLLGSLGLAGCQDGGGGGRGGGGTRPGDASAASQFVSVGTAPLGGTFYNVGAAIADALNSARDVGGWRKATAEATGGSLENLRRLEKGEIELGMANSSITYFAVRGTEGFDKKYEVKSVMTLFPLIAMFVTRTGSGMETIQDLKGKRIAVGPEGAGFEYFVRPILREHGLSYDDFEDVYAGMQTSVGYLQDESIAATFLGGGMVSPAITSAAATMNIRLVPYGDKERISIAEKYPSFHEVTVPAGTYKGQDTAFAGLNVGSAHLLVRVDANEEFVYRVTKVIYEARERIAETHAAAKAIHAKNVVRDTGTDFHPGAVRYYKEIGIWPENANTPKESAEGPGEAVEGQLAEETSK